MPEYRCKNNRNKKFESLHFPILYFVVFIKFLHDALRDLVPVSVHHPFLQGGIGGRVEPPTKFSKGGLETTLILRGSLARNKGVVFLRGD